MKLSSTEPLLGPGVRAAQTHYGAYCEIGEDSVLLNTTFEDYAYCGRLCDIANATVGKFANIASMVRIGPTDHPYHLPSQHHFLYRSSYYWDDAADDPDFCAARAARRVVLGPDCWIGHGAIIKPEVTLGAGAIVASGAVVTKDVPPFTIVGGTSAKVIRPRFAEPVIARLMDLAWWDWDHATLRARLADFRKLPVEAFLEKYERA